MINFIYLIAAYAIIAIVLSREVILKYFNIDINELTVSDIINRNWHHPVIKKNTGVSSLKLLRAGTNKETVMATLRSITGIDYASAKKIVSRTPITFMQGISTQEAKITKKALEYVGAEVKILK